MKTRFLWLTIFFVIVLCSFENVNACSCRGGANPCGFYRAQVGVAFIGTVTNVVDSNEKYGQKINGKARKITIKVDEVFKGNLPNQIITSDDGFRCDNFPFKLGQSYLIYSKGILENTENILPVGLCSGTAAVENAKDSINFLRQLKNGVMPSMLYGKVQRVINDEKNPYQALAKTKVVLTKIYSIENGKYEKPKKNDRNFETFTDENGEYKFENLKVGQYKLSAELPNDLWMQEYREFGTGGAPSCDFHSLYAFTNGSISGNVVNADSTPAHLALRITPIDKETRLFYNETRTDEKGNFTFAGLNEGRYKVSTGLNSYSLDGARTYLFSNDFPFGNFYFPNTFQDKEAETITLGYNQKIQNINLKMPSAPTKRTINGTVVWENGRSAEKGVIYYKIKKLGESSPRYAYAKEDGTFSLQVYNEFEYEISAENNSQENYGYSGWILLNKNDLDNQIKLILKPKK